MNLVYLVRSMLGLLALFVLAMFSFGAVAEPEHTYDQICSMPDRTEEIAYLCETFEQNSTWYIARLNELDYCTELDRSIYEAEVEGYRGVVASYYESVSRRNRLSAAAFEDQQNLGDRLELLTYIVVISALIFIAAQLYLSVKVYKLALGTELEATGKSFKLRTQVIGLVVLVISVIFLGLFYYFVYTIDVLESEKPPRSLVAPEASIQ